MKTQFTTAQITDAGFDADEVQHVRALCALLACEPSDLKREAYEHYGLNLYSHGGASYAVGTDEEATKAATENIRDSVWAFNAPFILSECGLPDELSEAIQSFQEKECEDANDALLALVEKCCKGGLKAFAEAAIDADGRGHFLAGYDHEENDETITYNTGDRKSFYIYRTN